MSSEHTGLILPSELECKVFQMLAADYLLSTLPNDPPASRELSDSVLLRNLATLDLISRRVQIWTREVLYRVVSVLNYTVEKSVDGSKVEVIRAHPSWLRIECVGRYIKNLAFGNSRRRKEYIPQVVELCPNIENFNFVDWVGDTDLSSIIWTQPLLRKVTIELSLMPLDTFKKFDFSKLTHLDACNMPSGFWKDDSSEGGGGSMAALHHVTHLSLTYDASDSPIHRIVAILRDHPCLSVLTIIDLNDSSIPTDYGRLVSMTDHRLVIIMGYSFEVDARDWRESAHGGFGLWEFSETLSEARRCSYLKNPKQRPVSRSFDWEQELNDRGRQWYNGRSVRDWIE